VVWRSYELCPTGAPPIPPEYLARIKASEPRLIQIAGEQYGLELNRGPLGVQSRLALIGAKYAEAQGKGWPYHDAVFRAYWQRANNIGDVDVLAEIARSIGLDRGAFLAALNDEQFEAQVEADVEQAYYYGLTGVPALIFGERYLVSGAQPYEVLRQVVEKVETGRKGDRGIEGQRDGASGSLPASRACGNGGFRSILKSTACVTATVWQAAACHCSKPWRFVCSTRSAHQTYSSWSSCTLWIVSPCAARSGSAAV
jgi:predicted DsbA family dithiol-disulfide isomerase